MKVNILKSSHTTQLKRIKENRRDNEEKKPLHETYVRQILKRNEEHFQQISREIEVKPSDHCRCIYGLLSRYDATHHLMYCENLKISSSTWATHFLRLNNVQDDPSTPVHGLNRKVCPPLFGEEREEFLNTGLSFIVVRDPFQRLLSAYLVKTTLEISKKPLISILGQTQYGIYNWIKRMDYIWRCPEIHKKQN